MNLPDLLDTRKEREAAYVNRLPVDLDRTIEDLEEEERREGFLDGERLDEPAEQEGGALLPGQPASLAQKRRRD